METRDLLVFEMRVWICWFIEIVSLGIQLFYEIVIQGVNYGFDITTEYLLNIRLAKWNCYKRTSGVLLSCISCSRFILINEIHSFLCIMSQSQLLHKSEMKNGNTTRNVSQIHVKNDGRWCR